MECDIVSDEAFAVFFRKGIFARVQVAFHLADVIIRQLGKHLLQNEGLHTLPHLIVMDHRSKIIALDEEAHIRDLPQSALPFHAQKEMCIRDSPSSALPISSRMSVQPSLCPVLGPVGRLELPPPPLLRRTQRA